MYQWLLFGHLIAVTALIGALGVNASVLLTLTRAHPADAQPAEPVQHRDRTSTTQR